MLIESIARTGIPAIFSAGMSTFAETEDALNVFYKTGGKNLLILHCVSLYPTPPKELNLLKIPFLISKFDCPIGFSDHSEGLLAAFTAVSLGATLIEKHFTMDKNLPGPDHQFSADPEEFKNLVLSIRSIEKSLGKSESELSEAENDARKQFRLSCITCSDIQKDEVLDENKIALKRPGTGIPANQYSLLIGKRAKRFLPKNTFIKFQDISTE